MYVNYYEDLQFQETHGKISPKSILSGIIFYIKQTRM